MTATILLNAVLDEFASSSLALTATPEPSGSDAQVDTEGLGQPSALLNR